MFSRSISFSLQRVKTKERTSDLETRDKISIDSKQKRKKKILPRLCLLFKEQVSLVDQKFKKTATNFTTEVRTEKIKKKKSVGERNTLCCTDLVTAHLSNVLAFERVFLFERRTTRTRLFQRRRW